jgi:hypothetical protein
MGGIRDDEVTLGVWREFVGADRFGFVVNLFAPVGSP